MATAEFPQGIERMLLLAVLDENFRKLLLADRAAAPQNYKIPLIKLEHNPPDDNSYGGK
jgi:hypothetical protein